MMNLNAKNSENRTALDKAASAEIERKLLKGGAQRGSSVEDNPTLADQLRSKITGNRKIITHIRRTRANISDKHREAYLVAAALILTGIYQSALSPPGGVYQADSGANKLNATSSLNSTATATPENAGKSVLSADDFVVASVLFNTLVLLATTLTMLILLPTGSVFAPLALSIFSFAISYLLSLRFISPTPAIGRTVDITTGFFIVIEIWVFFELLMMELSKLNISKKMILRRLKIIRT